MQDTSANVAIFAQRFAHIEQVVTSLVTINAIRAAGGAKAEKEVLGIIEREIAPVLEIPFSPENLTSPEDALLLTALRRFRDIYLGAGPFRENEEEQTALRKLAKAAKRVALETEKDIPLDVLFAHERPSYFRKVSADRKRLSAPSGVAAEEKGREGFIHLPSRPARVAKKDEDKDEMGGFGDR
jgi:hypothetical protein